MKPIRFITVVLTAALLVSFVGITFPIAQGAPKYSGLAQGINNASLDLALNSPLTFMASAPAVSFKVDAVSSSSSYSCSLLAQSPADWTRMGRRQYFDAKWK